MVELIGMQPYQSLYMRGGALILISIAVQWVGLSYFAGNPGQAPDYESFILVQSIVSSASTALLVIGIGIILISVWHQVARHRDLMA